MDRIAASLVALAIADVAAYAVHRGGSPLGGTGTTLAVLLVPACAAIALAVVARGNERGAAWRVSRVVVYGAILSIVSVLTYRFTALFPPGRTADPVENSVGDAVLLRLTPDLRLRWALRVAAQAVSASGLPDSGVSIPTAWPFPPNVALLAASTSDSVVLIASEPGSARECRFSLFLRVPLRGPREGRHDPIHCGRPRKRIGLEARPVSVRRRELPVAGESPVATGDGSGAWPQYRSDAARSGRAAGSTLGAVTWRAFVDGEIRSSPAVAGGAVLVGTHGAGALQAFDAATGALRWLDYVPNWIHQDAVSDGRIVVVGFGDNDGALFGESPAGVSAFSLSTGALLWSAFDGNSVMTSPVIWRGRAVYVTSAGVLRVRDLRTGVETARLTLPGRDYMAPPALLGDTLILSLDPATVCVVGLERLEKLWCRVFPQLELTGHAAPTVVGGRVYASSAVTNVAVKAPGPLGVPGWTWYRLKVAFGLFRTRQWWHSGQRVQALDLATGRSVWVSPTYPSVRDPGGHISGTLLVVGHVGAVLLPLAGTMVGVDLDNGRALWRRESGASRGPVADVGGLLLMAQRTGELLAVRPRTGEVTCSIPTGQTFDRSGPAMAGATVFLGSTAGSLYAIPVTALSTCSRDVVRALFP